VPGLDCDNHNAAGDCRASWFVRSVAKDSSILADYTRFIAAWIIWWRYLTNLLAGLASGGEQ
jgi:hypothetical protein